LKYSDFLTFGSKSDAIATSKQLTVPVITMAGVVDAIAIADV
jgi:hypothetical protein